MRKHLISIAGSAVALAFAGGAQAQLLGGNVAGGVTGGAPGLGVGAQGGLGAGVGADLGAAAGETVGAVARTPAGVDATVRGGAFRAQPDAALNAAARTGVDIHTDASLPAEMDIRAQGDTRAAVRAQGAAYAPRHYDHGSHIYVENKGWVWVPSGARLNADGTVSVATGAAVDTVAGAAAGLNAGARISGGRTR